MAATPPPAARLRWDQVMAWRAARHHLDERVPAKAMLEVAGRIAGLHAQVLSSAEPTGSRRLGDKLLESWGALLKPAAALGLICFAPGKGQQVRFTRPDTWLGGWTDHDPEQAMDEVPRRFLAASGPVSREDFALWWGIPSPARGARLLQRLGEEVARVEGAAAYALAAWSGGQLELAGPTTSRRASAWW